MPNVTLSTPLPVSAKQVWDLIGGFNALPNWHPIVERSEVEEDKPNRTTTRIYVLRHSHLFLCLSLCHMNYNHLIR